MRVIKLYGLLFLATGVPFGLLMGVTSAALFGVGDIGGGFAEGLLTGLVAGVVFGVLMALVLGTMQVVGFRNAPRGASLSPKQARDVAVVTGPDLADRILSALRTLPAEVTGADVPAGRYAARTRRTWTGWGEEVVVQLTGDPARPVATIASRPRLRTTMVDYGKGRRNVEHVVRALDAR